MASRQNLQTLLESILGSRNVYFQPPASIRMSYPAIKYSLKSIDNTFADDVVYSQDIGYEITVIDSNPDSNIVKDISKLPKCRFDRSYSADNLNHVIFTLYF